MLNDKFNNPESIPDDADGFDEIYDSLLAPDRFQDDMDKISDQDWQDRDFVAAFNELIMLG
jgi:hypothetical protein